MSSNLHVTKSGGRLASWSRMESVSFTATDTVPITEAIAAKEQERLGYHPAGYGFFGFQCDQIADDAFQARWYCSGSASD